MPACFQKRTAAALTVLACTEGGFPSPARSAHQHDQAGSDMIMASGLRGDGGAMSSR